MFTLSVALGPEDKNMQYSEHHYPCKAYIIIAVSVKVGRKYIFDRFGGKNQNYELSWKTFYNKMYLEIH